ncbi:MAG: DJ-1/PfpI family protein [Acidobacteria bacterium]|nr:DJ-1/PfpI family protein [Acidobacteriota bacterium]
MTRKEWFKTATALSLAVILVPVLGSFARTGAKPDSAEGNKSAALPNPLTPPGHGSIPVAFLISEGAVMIDFAGPWEVFQDVNIPARQGAAFRLYTVAETRKPVHASGGMTLVPDYTISDAPAPRVIVIPAQSPLSEATKRWVRRAAPGADVTMSVCTGAFMLASTGLLSGKAATTHHSSYAALAEQFPDIEVERGKRFVEVGNLATAGGLTSGIDLALRVVERYFGREAARQTAFDMEYQGEGWINAASNGVYARAYTQSDEHPLCPVCGMAVDPQSAPKSIYKGKTYYFGSSQHKEQFDRDPEQFLHPPEK